MNCGVRFTIVILSVGVLFVCARPNPIKNGKGQGFPVVGPRPFLQDQLPSLFNNNSVPIVSNSSANWNVGNSSANWNVGNSSANGNVTSYNTTSMIGYNDTDVLLNMTVTPTPDYYYYYENDEEENDDEEDEYVGGLNGTMITPVNGTMVNGSSNLLVRWGKNPAMRGRKTFIPLPLTETEAIAQEWTLDSDACAAVDPTYWRGRRYRLKGDIAISLIYDRLGSLAGLQTAFTPTDPVVYPDTLVYRNVFNTEGAQRVGTVYFKQPLSICNEVNVTEQAAQGWENLGDEIGDQLFIQTGTDPINQYAHIHKSEMELVTKSMWRPGSCLNGIGRHYWFNLTMETPCANFVPVSLLYDEGTLKGFSWVFRADENQAEYASPLYERMNPAVMQTFFQQNLPVCLVNKPLVSMHFFFSPTPWDAVC